MLVRTTRRSFLAAAPALLLGAGRSTDIRIEDVNHSFEDYLYRTPIKFGGNEVNKVTLLNVNVVVRSGSGKTAKGFGSMCLGNVWSFPSKTMSYERTLEAMKQLSDRMTQITRGFQEQGHPVDLSVGLEPLFSTRLRRSQQAEAGRSDPETLHSGDGQCV